MIDELVRKGHITESTIDPENALAAIGLWKSSWIPPDRAGHRTAPELSLIYRDFEERREKQKALTFDDYIPLILNLLSQNPDFRKQYAHQLDHLIVDEYQDINYGQQQMIRLLSGPQTDVMVVGDDDQTIYEWRGARPTYILKDFAKDFSDKPVEIYSLSHAFRFGPQIAQAAYNVIIHSGQRKEKKLIAYDLKKHTGITILAGRRLDRASACCVQTALVIPRPSGAHPWQ